MPRQTAPRSRRPASGQPERATAPAESPGAAVLDALRAVNQKLRTIERDASDGLGVPPAQATVLRALADRPARSLAELSRRVHTDSSSASVVVQRLVEAGLVARRNADDDRRRCEIALTTAGRVRLRRHPAPADDRVGSAVATLGEAQVRALLDALTALDTALD